MPHISLSVVEDANVIQRMQRLGWIPATVRGWAQVYAGAATLAGWLLTAIGFKPGSALILAATACLLGVDLTGYGTLYGRLRWSGRNKWATVGLVLLYMIAAPVPVYLALTWRKARRVRAYTQAARLERIDSLEHSLKV